MDITEKTMKSERVYEGRNINLRVDTVELPNKGYSKREVVEHPGAVAILAIDDEDNVILVKQYRKPAEEVLLELPAGKLEINEEPAVAAVRELKEETGYISKDIEFLFTYYTAPGFCDEKMHFFITRDIEKAETNFDADEFIEIVKMNKAEFVKMAEEGHIKDAKTVIAALMIDKKI